MIGVVRMEFWDPGNLMLLNLQLETSEFTLGQRQEPALVFPESHMPGLREPVFAHSQADGAN